MRLSLGDGDLIGQNPTLEDPTNQMLRQGSGLEHLGFSNKVMEPWELLLDLGQYCSFNYQILTMALADFKDVNEKTMANTLLHLAINHQGLDNA